MSYFYIYKGQQNCFSILHQNEVFSPSHCFIVSNLKNAEIKYVKNSGWDDRKISKYGKVI